MPQDRTNTITPATGRRRLGAALFAIGAGSVLTSGMAAGVAASADGGAEPPSDADAVLISICEAAEKAEHDSVDVGRSVEHVLLTDERYVKASKLSRQLYQQSRRGMNQAVLIPATTLAGLQAKAALALCELPSDDDEFTLVRAVLRQIAGKA